MAYFIYGCGMSLGLTAVGGECGVLSADGISRGVCSPDTAILQAKESIRNLTREHYIAIDDSDSTSEYGVLPCASTLTEIIIDLTKVHSDCSYHFREMSEVFGVALLAFAGIAANTEGAECMASLQSINFSDVTSLKPWKALAASPPPMVPQMPLGAIGGESSKSDAGIDQTGAVAGIIVGCSLCLAAMARLLLFRRMRLRQGFGSGGKVGDGESLADTRIVKTNGLSTIRGFDSVSADTVVEIVTGIVREAGLALLKEEDVIAERSIGQGSHGVVYSARWKNSNSPVAVKVLQLFGVTIEEIQKGARAITNELVVLNTVRHPSIIYVYGVIVTSDAYTPGCTAVRIVMELAECSLQQLLMQTASLSNTTTSTAMSTVPLLSSHAPPSESSSESQKAASRIHLSLKTRLRIAESVASGLSHLHNTQVPVVHRDLKPANILIRRQGDDVSACIADFGAALLDKTDMTLSNPESYLPQGTLMYMVGDSFALACVRNVSLLSITFLSTFSQCVHL